jgi:hypothetical protein
MFDFVTESNRIEGILRDPTDAELHATVDLVALPVLSVGSLNAFVAVVQPGAALRNRFGMDVRVGNHYPPRGGPEIEEKLVVLLEDITRGRLTPFEAHVRYETLHPYMDGNGRSGRAVWYWQMRHAPLGFLHTFYYQTLSVVGR